jgi:hypothetical protein
MADPNKLLATIRKATILFRATPGRVGSIVSPEADEILVVGDLHGHVHAFAAALKTADLTAHPRRHLVLQELVHDPRVDPDTDIDRSHRLVGLVCALKCQFPDRVHVLLGNHELSELTGRSIGKNGAFLNAMFRKGIEADFGNLADTFRAAYHELFAALPIAVRASNRVMLLHTLPDGDRIDDLDLDLLRTGVWTEPSMRRGGTVYALTWGRDTSPEAADRFASLIDADLFITGHHPCDGTHRLANHRHLILDATDPDPGYCLFDARSPATIEGLAAGVGRLGDMH